MPTLHGRDVAVWYDQEAVEGATDSGAANLSLSQHAEVSISEGTPQVPVTKSGDVDNAAIKKGWTYPVIRISGVPNTSNGKAFIKNFSSTDNSVTLIGKDTTGVFWRAVGCKVKRITGRCAIYPNGTGFEYDIEAWGMDLLFTEGAGSPTYEAVPNTFVNWSDCAVRIEGSVITNWYDLSWTLENDLEPVPDNTGAITTIKRGIRNITGNITRSVSGSQSAEFGEIEAATERDIRIDLVADQYLFTNSVWDEVPISLPISGIGAMRLSFICGQYSTV